jgi:hypothetical protein
LEILIKLYVAAGVIAQAKIAIAEVPDNRTNGIVLESAFCLARFYLASCKSISCDALGIWEFKIFALAG